MNWSIGDNTESNYLEPSRSQLKIFIFNDRYHINWYESFFRDCVPQFLMLEMSIVWIAWLQPYWIYMGDYLNEILDSIECEAIYDKTLSTINHGIEGLPKVRRYIDRNRTSPVAFTGNKFELRALGSSANGSDAAKVMNMLCAWV